MLGGLSRESSGFRGYCVTRQSQLVKAPWLPYPQHKPKCGAPLIGESLRIFIGLQWLGLGAVDWLAGGAAEQGDGIVHVDAYFRSWKAPGG